MKHVNNLFLDNCVRWLTNFPGEFDRLPIDLEEDLSKGIVEIKGLFFLKSLVDLRTDFSMSIIEDMTDDDKKYFELDHNELCMLNYGFPHTGKDTQRNASRAFAMGITASYRLATMLKPLGGFSIIHSFNYDFDNKLISSYLSFNKIRDSKPQWPNIDKDKVLGVMEIITD